ncbi:MAG TPA: HAD-IIIC family phosphatase [Polyangiaceae bacterium]|nr:HAD-IIIC family phosphatase [Polyangiaceae bacterium]
MTHSTPRAMAETGDPLAAVQSKHTDSTPTDLAAVTADGEKRSKKCVVWDLDDTLWEGVLLEGGGGRLRPGARELIQELDRRGILLSIASKNDADLALAALDKFGLREFFLYPQVHWGPKSTSIRAIASQLNIGLDALAFLDDQAFERDEVSFAFPEVLCLDSRDLAAIEQLDALKPRFITDESRLRRKMYASDAVRADAERGFEGTPEQFLASLGMRFSVARAKEDDLRRAEELTFRTNQLNTTGYTYGYDELARLIASDDHLVLVASLDDRYGTYGKIGLSLVERGSAAWTIKLLLMSCRVMSRGVGTVMLRHIMNGARRAGVRLLAEFVDNGRNRAMYVTYKFEGFRTVEQRNGAEILEADVTSSRQYPPYLELDLQELVP